MDVAGDVLLYDLCASGIIFNITKRKRSDEGIDAADIFMLNSNS